jgi:Uma2 family endonuclease
MVVIADEPLVHMVLPGISWETYEKILDEIGETHYRVTYADGELEFMTLSFEHQNYGRWIGRLIFVLAQEFGQPLRTGGSTTLKQVFQKKGLEPDECFWLQNEKMMRGKKKWDALADPPPDLAVEVDITSSWLDRLSIYADLKVAELWRFDGKSLKVLTLTANGKYRERARSLAFPSVPVDRLTTFIARVEDTEEVSLIQEFTTWLRKDVVGKKNGARKYEK